MGRFVALALGAFAAALPRATAAAQLITSVDAGLASVDDQSSAREGAVTFSPALRLERRHAAVSASGTVSLFQRGDWGAQGILAGSAFSPDLGPLRGELSVAANGVAFRDYSESWQYIAQLRAHLHREGRGVWIGGGTGQTLVGTTWNPLAVVDAGGWVRQGPIAFRGSASRAAIGLEDDGLPNGSGGIDGWVRYTELAGSLSLARGAFGLDLSGGLRAPDAAPIARWGTVSASVWFTPHVAAVATVGSYLSDPMHRLPGGSYAMLTMRLASGAGPRASGDTPSRAVDFVVSRAAEDGRRVIRIQAPRARRVELMGDFTDWRAVPLTREGGDVWHVELSIAPGTYRLSVRVDGGEWRAPPGIPAITDEFDGQVGVIVLQ